VVFLRGILKATYYEEGENEPISPSAILARGGGLAKAGMSFKNGSNKLIVEEEEEEEDEEDVDERVIDEMRLKVRSGAVRCSAMRCGTVHVA
jgi:hypothetical protein